MRLFFLASLLSLNSCASLSAPPALELRTLWPSEKPGVYFYEREACLKKFLGICTKKGWITEEYDLKDPVMWEKLKNINFVLRRLEMP